MKNPFLDRLKVPKKKRQTITDSLVCRVVKRAKKPAKRKKP